MEERKNYGIISNCFLLINWTDLLGVTIIFRGLKNVMINDMIRNQLTRLYKGKCSVIIRARTMSSNSWWTECQGWGLVRGIRLILISCLLFCFVFSPFPLLYYLSLIRLIFFFKNTRGEEVEKGGSAFQHTRPHLPIKRRPGLCECLL